MAPRYKGPHLLLRERAGRRSVWVIRDNAKEISTLCGADDKDAAEKALWRYCEQTNTPLKPGKWDRPRNFARELGTIYFISSVAADYPIKIGIVYGSLRSRLKSLQSGNPSPLVVLALMPGTVSGERDLHKQFKASRMQSEWFRRTPELMALIEKVNAPDNVVSA